MLGKVPRFPTPPIISVMTDLIICRARKKTKTGQQSLYKNILNMIPGKLTGSLTAPPDQNSKNTEFALGL